MLSRRVQELTDTDDSDLAVWECIDKREAENAIIKACSKVWEAGLEQERKWKKWEKDADLRRNPAAEMTPAARWASSTEDEESE